VEIRRSFDIVVDSNVVSDDELAAVLHHQGFFGLATDAEVIELIPAHFSMGRGREPAAPG
jgi:hypothetical protein